MHLTLRYEVLLLWRLRGRAKRVGLLQVENATKSKIPRHHHLNMGKSAWLIEAVFKASK